MIPIYERFQGLAINLVNEIIQRGVLQHINLIPTAAPSRGLRGSRNFLPGPPRTTAHKGSPNGWDNMRPAVCN